ncbi:MAG: ThiF family adenylyltransferase [Planctomycetota bacterium]
MAADINNSLENGRYSRQVRFPGIGTEGQISLQAGRATIIGCGALGSVSATMLARAGVGFLRLIDRDFLETSNLQRQLLYDENDVQSNLPKSVIASQKLRQINSTIQIEPHVIDVDPANIHSLCSDVDVIIDGTDNFETRFLINDFAVKNSIPWVYGGCLGADGQVMTIVPGQTACLHCLMIDGPPLPGTSPTCDSFGILGPVIGVVGSMQAIEGLKILSGEVDCVNSSLTAFSLWTNQVRQVDLSKLRSKVNCPTCKSQVFSWLDGHRASQTAVLCGRNAVQLSFDSADKIDLQIVKNRLLPLGEVVANAYLLKFKVESFELTLFPDGRAIVKGTEDPVVAKRLYAQYFGN